MIVKTIASLLIALATLDPGFGLSAPLGVSAFAYNASAPLNIQVHARHRKGGVSISDITFDSADGRRVHAELAAPIAGEHHAAVLFVHWLGDDPATTNLSEFRADAMRLAGKGCVTLSIDAMWAQPNWFDKMRSLDTDFRNSIDQVVDIRRSLDVLLTQPGVDRERVAYVGHDFGAMYGAVLSGVDSRPRYYVLMAGTTTFAEWYLLGKHPADTARYRQMMSVLDPPQYLARSHAKAYFFQFANNDRYIQPDRALTFFRAAPAPKTLSVYVADHGLNVASAHADRIAWLMNRL